MSTAQQARQPGGRFGAAPKPPSPEPPTARQQLDALRERRAQGNGWLVPPPAGINNARLVLADGMKMPNAEWRILLGWWEAIVDAGGTPGDLDRAWHHWNPSAGPGAHPRMMARDSFDQLKARAGPRYVELCRQAARERQAERDRQDQVLAERRAPYVAAVAAAEAALKKAKQELDAVR